MSINSCLIIIHNDISFWACNTNLEKRFGTDNESRRGLLTASIVSLDQEAVTTEGRHDALPEDIKESN